MTSLGQFELVLVLLVAILVLSVAARKLHLPPAAAFILGGAALALSPRMPTITFDPALVLVLFLPPLLMSSAFFTAWREFRDNISGILMLAVGAVIFTTFAVGFVVHLLVPTLPWAVCFALGAVVSPPDAVAAEAVLERLRLPRRLVALLQGESLLNDAAGLVLFRFSVVAALTGAFSVGDATIAFVGVSVGGVLVGAAIGIAGSNILRRMQDVDLAIMLQVLTPWAAYIGGERLGVSGVIATVVAGMIIGWRQHADMSAAMRMRSHAFWSVFTFTLEALVFILIGLSMRGVLARVRGAEDATTLLVTTLAVIVAVVVTRFIWVFGFVALRRTFRPDKPRLSYKGATVASWAGMRGVVTLAAALTLPESLPGRDLVLAASFGVILATVLVQGTTLGPLVRLLRFEFTEPTGGRMLSEEAAWVRIAQAQLAAIQSASRQEDGTERHPRLLEQYGYRARATANYAADRDKYRVHEIEHFSAVLAAVRAGRAEVLRLHRAGEIHDSVLVSLERSLDLEEMEAGLSLD